MIQFYHKNAHILNSHAFHSISYISTLSQDQRLISRTKINKRPEITGLLNTWIIENFFVLVFRTFSVSPYCSMHCTAMEDQCNSVHESGVSRPTFLYELYVYHWPYIMYRS